MSNVPEQGDNRWLVGIVVILVIGGIILLCVVPPVVTVIIRAVSPSESKLTTNDLIAILPQPNEVPSSIWYGSEYEFGVDELSEQPEELKQLGLENSVEVTYGVREYLPGTTVHVRLFRNADGAGEAFSLWVAGTCSSGFFLRTRESFPVNNLGDQAIGFKCGVRPGGPGSDDKFFIYIWRSRNILLELVAQGPPGEKTEKEVDDLARKIQSRVR